VIIELTQVEHPPPRKDQTSSKVSNFAI
jgi:hypothetical protein